MKNLHVLFCAVACLLALCLLPVVLAEEKEKPKSGGKEKEAGKDAATADESEKKTDAKSDAGAGGKTGEDNADGSPRTGIRDRRGYKQRLEEAVRKAEEDKERRREAREADEKRRREAIQRAKEELAARKKQLAENPSQPEEPLPPKKLTTIKMENGSCFQGVVIGETDDEIVLQVECGEMTFPKKLIESIRRPPPPASAPKKTPKKE